MSVQRWTTTLSEARYRMDDGPFVLYADHARIVGEMEQANYEQGFRDGMASARAAVVAEAESGFYTDVDDALTAIDEATANGVLRYESDERKAAAPRTLTADDPEPAVGSVVLDANGHAWQRHATLHPDDPEWLMVGHPDAASWADVLAAHHSLTLIHDGGAA